MFILTISVNPLNTTITFAGILVNNNGIAKIIWRVWKAPQSIPRAKLKKIPTKMNAQKRTVAPYPIVSAAFVSDKNSATLLT
jgi:hypothetical protein